MARTGWAILATVLGVGVAAMPPPPAPLDPSRLVPSRRYDVRILRDTWGVPHVFGRTDADAAYGLAWAHAEDDFDTIQGALLAARGRLATRLGPDGAPNDYLVQLLQITRGNVTQAAKLAGRNRTDFYKLLARHGLQSEEFKIR